MSAANGNGTFADSGYQALNDIPPTKSPVRSPVRSPARRTHKKTASSPAPAAAAVTGNGELPAWNFDTRPPPLPVVHRPKKESAPPSAAAAVSPKSKALPPNHRRALINVVLLDSLTPPPFNFIHTASSGGPTASGSSHVHTHTVQYRPPSAALTAILNGTATSPLKLATATATSTPDSKHSAGAGVASQPLSPTSAGRISLATRVSTALAQAQLALNSLGPNASWYNALAIRVRSLFASDSTRADFVRRFVALYDEQSAAASALETASASDSAAFDPAFGTPSSLAREVRVSTLTSVGNLHSSSFGSPDQLLTTAQIAGITAPGAGGSAASLIVARNQTVLLEMLAALKKLKAISEVESLSVELTLQSPVGFAKPQFVGASKSASRWSTFLLDQHTTPSDWKILHGRYAYFARVPIGTGRSTSVYFGVNKSGHPFALKRVPATLTERITGPVRATVLRACAGASPRIIEYLPPIVMNRGGDDCAFIVMPLWEETSSTPASAAAAATIANGTNARTFSVTTLLAATGSTASTSGGDELDYKFVTPTKKHSTMSLKAGSAPPLWQGFEQSWKESNRKSAAGSMSRQGRARPHAQTSPGPAHASNAIHSIADLAEAEDGLAAAADSQRAAGAGAADDASDNAFVLPKEDVFLLREREHKQRRDARDRALKQKIWMRATVSGAPPVPSAPSAIAAAAAALTAGGSSSAAGALPSRRGRTGGAPAVGGGSSSSSSASSENMAEFIAKKRVMFLIQTSLDTKNQEIQKLEEKAAMKEDALKKSEEMLAEDASRFNKFLEDNDNKVKEAIYKADRAAKKKNKKQEKIKRLHAAITRINTRIQKQKAAQLKYEEYENFLNSLLPREVKQRIEEVRAAREKAAKERPASSGVESRISTASKSTNSAATGNAAAGTAGTATATTSASTTLPAAKKTPAKAAKTKSAAFGGGLSGLGGGGVPGLESDVDSDEDSEDDELGSLRGPAGVGLDDDDDDAADDDDDERSGRTAGDDAQRIGAKEKSEDDPSGGAVEEDPEVAHWSDPETLFEMFEHLEEEILFKMQNVHEAEASLEALKALKLDTEQKMSSQRAQLNTNIADLRMKIAAERAKVAAIRLRYQTGEDTKIQESHEARLSAAIRQCYIASVFQNTGPNANANNSGDGDDEAMSGRYSSASNAAPQSPYDSDKKSVVGGTGAGGVVVLDDAEKMMKDIEVELGSRLKQMEAFKLEKPDVYAAIEKHVRDLIFRTSYPAQMKKEQLSQEQERIRKAEAQADKPIIKRTGKILMVRSHLAGKPKKENTTPRKNQDEEDRLLFLS